MIEEEFFNEIKQDKGVDEPCLFPKEEWDSLIREEKCADEDNIPKQKWQPVSNIDEIYKGLPEVLKFHKLYEKLWLKR